MRRIVTLTEASDSDDILCRDGEYLADEDFSAVDVEVPGPPQVTFTAVARALPPYSTVDGQLPRFTVSGPASSDMSGAVENARQRFLVDVKRAGLFFDQTAVAAAWLTAEGNLRQRSAPVLIGDASTPVMRTVGVETHDGLTYLTVEISRSPFSIEYDPSAAMVLLPEAWRGRIAGVEIVTATAVDALPTVAPLFVHFFTRPLKLGDPFAVKHLEEVHALWPDGSRWPLRVFGAMRCGAWRCLGSSPQAHMRLRGSGWRFFRVESYGTPGEMPVMMLRCRD